MKCSKADCDGETHVIDSRPNAEDNMIRRRRKCNVCGERFSTYEITIDPSQLGSNILVTQEEHDALVAARTAVSYVLARTKVHNPS